MAVSHSTALLPFLVHIPKAVELLFLYNILGNEVIRFPGPKTDCLELAEVIRRSAAWSPVRHNLKDIATARCL